jgi:hypothetical protein
MPNLYYKGEIKGKAICNINKMLKLRLYTSPHRGIIAVHQSFSTILKKQADVRGTFHAV